MTGIEIAVATYLFTWAKRRGKAVAKRAGGEADQTVDLLMDRLHTVVAEKLGPGTPALARLEREAGEDRARPSDTTTTLLSATLTDAIETDPALGPELARLVAELKRSEAASGRPATVISGDVHNSVSGGTHHGVIVQARDIDGVEGLVIGERRPRRDG